MTRPPSERGTVRWMRAPEGSLRWASWNDEYAVYHRPSGRTHFLNAASAFLLEEVLGEPTTAEEAADALAGVVDRPAGDPDRAAQVFDVLARLEQVGLVERA